MSDCFTCPLPFKFLVFNCLTDPSCLERPGLTVRLFQTFWIKSFWEWSLMHFLDLSDLIQQGLIDEGASLGPF